MSRLWKVQLELEEARESDDISELQDNRLRVTSGEAGKETFYLDGC